MTGPVGGFQSADSVSAASRVVANLTEEKAEEQLAMKVDSDKDLESEVAEDGAAVVTQTKNASKIDQSSKLEKKEDVKPGEVIPIEKVGEKADGFTKKNPEYKPSFLVALTQKIKPGQKSTEILAAVIKSCSEDVDPKITDPYLVKIALEFLKEVTRGDLQAEVMKAIEEFTNPADPKNKENIRAIEAGGAIIKVAREASKEGAGEINELLTLYQDVTKTSRDSVTLFFELKAKYPNPKDREAAIAFLLKSLGAEKETKSSDIEHAKLADIINEIGSVRAAGKVEDWFKKRDPFIDWMLAQHGEN